MAVVIRGSGDSKVVVLKTSVSTAVPTIVSSQKRDYINKDKCIKIAHI